MASVGAAIATLATWSVVSDSLATIELDFAAVEEHPLELHASALDAGLHSRERDTGALRRLGLAQALELGQDECLAVSRR